MDWLNDWPLKKCLVTCASVTALQAVLGVLSGCGIGLPVLPQVVGFLFLTFVPGILLLRILRVHGINPVEAVLYSAGLSLAAGMFYGLLLNFALPAMRIDRPFSGIPLKVGFTVLSAVLICLALVRDRRYQPTGSTPGRRLKLTPLLLLAVLLLFFILGVLINGAFRINALLEIGILAICLLIVLASFGKLITKDVYPLALFVISLCLLYQTTLMTPYMIGTDIFVEHSVYRQVAALGVWDPALTNPVNPNVNSCLSIAMLAPAYSMLADISGIWVFKAVYPLLFSLLPVVLYRTIRIQLGPVRAFLAVIFFIIVPTYLIEMISLCRQQVAELFFALTILLIIEKKLSMVPKIIMAIVFTASVAVSHYSMGFISFIYLGLLIPLVLILKSSPFLKLWASVTRWSGGLPGVIREESRSGSTLIVLLCTVVPFFVLAFSWYIIVAGGTNYAFLRDLWNSMASSVFGEIGRVTSSAVSAPAASHAGQSDIYVKAALGLDFMSSTPQGQAFRVFQLLTQALIIIGCFRLILKPSGLKLRVEYVAMSLTSAFVLAACFLVPSFAAALNTSRWYHITLIVLAPFCILGGEIVWNWLVRLFRLVRRWFPSTPVFGEVKGTSPFLALAVLVPYFIFTSGLVYEITSQSSTDHFDTPYSIALTGYRVDLIGVFTSKDGAAADWLTSRAERGPAVYTDSHVVKLLDITGYRGPAAFFTDDGYFQPGSLILLSEWNVESGRLTFVRPNQPGLRFPSSWSELPKLQQSVSRLDVIYTNGGAQVRGPVLPLSPSPTP